MNGESKNCLINESACGRIEGNPVCPKCGMDERVVYPGQSDLDSALFDAKVRFSSFREKTCVADDEQPPECQNVQRQIDLDANLSRVYFFYAFVFVCLSVGYFEKSDLSGWQYLIGVGFSAVGLWGLVRGVWFALLPFLVYCIYILAIAFPFFYDFWVNVLSKYSVGSFADGVLWVLFVVFFMFFHAAILFWFVWGLIGMALAMLAIWRSGAVK